VVRVSSPFSSTLRSSGRRENRRRDPRGWCAAAGHMRRGCAASSSGADAFFSFLGALLCLFPSLSLSSRSSIFSHRSQRRRQRLGVPRGGVRRRWRVGGVRRRPGLGGVLVMSCGGRVEV
jgi:hypothetical protein